MRYPPGCGAILRRRGRKRNATVGRGGSRTAVSVSGRPGLGGLWTTGLLVGTTCARVNTGRLPGSHGPRAGSQVGAPVQREPARAERSPGASLGQTGACFSQTRRLRDPCRFRRSADRRPRDAGLRSCVVVQVRRDGGHRRSDRAVRQGRPARDGGDPVGGASRRRLQDRTGGEPSVVGRHHSPTPRPQRVQRDRRVFAPVAHQRPPARHARRAGPRPACRLLTPRAATRTSGGRGRAR